jgi:hypothetical protein
MGSPPLKEWGVRSKGAGADLRERAERADHGIRIFKLREQNSHEQHLLTRESGFILISTDGGVLYS